MGQGAGHGVRACRRSFHHHIRGGIHNIGVVTQTTVHGVVASGSIEGVVAIQSIEHVVAGIARDGVGQGVPCADDGRAREDQVLNVGCKGVVNGAVDGVGSCSRRLHDHIQGVVHLIDVVS